MAKKPKKQENVVETPAEGGELTPYEAMDLVDEGQIVDELEGKLTPADMETFVYSFPDKATGKEITGLSWKGTKATWWELNKRKLTDMTVTDKVIVTQGEDFVDVAVYAFDEKRKIGAWGMARGYTKMQTRSGAVVDRFASAKAMSKAQRNALNQLFPSDLVAKIIQKWIKTGNVRKLDAQAVSQVQDRLSRPGATAYPSQEELMAKYKMDPKQVTPKCPSCGETMRIVERKDKSGIFWSCPNWRSKGCKGYNIDDIDIDGTISMKKKSNAKPKVEEEKVEDIPF